MGQNISVRNVFDWVLLTLWETALRAKKGAVVRLTELHDTTHFPALTTRDSPPC